MNLTIITAIHDRLDGLMNVFKSLENQTYQGFEHILVDDCSTEINYEKLEELCKNNPHRHFVRLGFRSHFYGCFARDIGTLLAFSYIHHSRRDIDNEWVIYLDTDNEWKPNHLESMIKALEENPQLTMIGADMEMIGVNDKSWKQIRPCRIKQGYCDIGSFMYKTSLFRKYGYWFAHPHRKHKYDVELIKKIVDGEYGKVFFTNQATFLMSYRKK